MILFPVGWGESEAHQSRTVSHHNRKNWKYDEELSPNQHQTLDINTTMKNRMFEISQQHF